MSIASSTTVTLGNRYARDLPELAVPWRAEEPPQPRLLVLDERLAVELGLDPEWLRSPDGVRLLTGAGVPADATPVAQAYAGHQFGSFVTLGDGRALLLGELTDTAGRPRDLHLKGSGRTGTRTATSPASPSGTSPGSPRRCCRCCTTTRSRPSRRR